MTRILIFCLICLSNPINAKALNKEEVYSAIVKAGIKHPKIVLAQAILETGWFKSKLCRKGNNLFGLIKIGKQKRFNKTMYASYNDWKTSIKLYKKIQKNYKSGNYYDFLIKKHYAEDKTYISKLKIIVASLKVIKQPKQAISIIKSKPINNMKLTVDFGDELKHANIEYPKQIPVMQNGKIIGEVIHKSKDGVFELDITNKQEISSIKQLLHLGVGGTVTSREGNLITGFDLKEVSIQLKQK